MLAPYSLRCSVLQIPSTSLLVSFSHCVTLTLQNSVPGFSVPNCYREGLVLPCPQSILGLRGKAGRIFPELGQI